MWFVTEVLPGIIAVTVFACLAISNVSLRRKYEKSREELLEQKARDTAVEMSQLQQMVNGAVQSLKEGG